MDVVRTVILRLAATLVLLAVIVGVPVGVVALTGRALPDIDHLSTAWRTGIVDDHVLLAIGAALFVVLWAWFSLAALAEVVRVTRWRVDGRRGRRSVLGTPAGTPAGWVRRLVRVALLSTTVMASSGTVPSVGFAFDGDVTDRASAPTLVIDGRTVEPTEVAYVQNSIRQTMVSSGRETPYSVASRAGDPSLRGQIIETHRGRRAPDGTVWMGGVFPAGMEIEIPVIVAQPPVVHTVERGESYWSIAEDHLALDEVPDAPIDIAILTEALISTNSDGFGRSDPTLLLPGDLLTLPPLDAPVVVVQAPPPPSAQPSVDDTVPAATDGPSAELPAVEAASSEESSSSDSAPPLHFDEPVGVPGSPAVLPVSARSSASTTAIHDDGLLTPAPASATAATAQPASERSMTTTVGGTVLLAAGALGLLESRRRHQLRHSGSGTTTEPPTPSAVTTERALRALAADERAARLDIALRSIGHLLSDTARHVVAVRAAADGRMTAYLDGRAPLPIAPWQAGLATDVWILPSAVPTTDLADTARRSGQPCPAMVHLGTSTDGEDVFVDVEAIGLLRIDGPVDSVGALTAAIATALAASPLSETIRLVTHGIDLDAHLGNLNAEAAESLDAAIDRAVTGVASTTLTTGGDRTFHLRSRMSDGTGETWEPAIIVSNDPACIRDEVVEDLRMLTLRAGRGLGVVIGTTGEGQRASLDHATWVLRTNGTAWTLDPLGIELVPAGLSPDALNDLSQLLDAAERPMMDTHATAPKPSGISFNRDASVTARNSFVEADWSLMVRVLGQVAVLDRSGRSLEFERGKSLELLAWLSQRGERPTRSAARTALWDVDVRDATFANVVSDARRSMARAVPPPDGEEWIHRTLTDALPLHACVTSDAALLRSRVGAAVGLDPAEAIEILRPGLELVTDLPFAGTSYLWPDAEGITSSLILLTTGAAADLARHHLALGDIDGVFWATGQGLKVLSGHEELIGLRMRAHAHAGDLAGVRCEWDVYRRALDADSWSGAEPSPKLVAIHRELLATR